MKIPQQDRARTPRSVARHSRAQFAGKLVAMFCAAAGLAGPTLAASTEASEGPGVGAGAAEAPPAPHRKATLQPGASPLDRRIALLAAELDLNSAQQRQVKALLLRQREAIQQVWGDTSLPPAIRVSRTQAISDRTADGIRALLDDEQRKKYIQPRQREASVGTGGAGVEAWTARAAGQ